MSHAVWKYTLRDTDLQVVDMPAGAQLLRVGVQGVSEVQLWALVEPDQPTVRRLIAIHGTGHEVRRLATSADPVGALPKYVGTFELALGQLVFHVFDHGVV